MFSKIDSIYYCVYLVCVFFQAIWITPVCGEPQFPNPFGGYYPYPLGPSIYPNRQGGYVHHPSLTQIQNVPFVQRPLSSQQPQIIVFPSSFNRFPSSDIRIRPSGSFQSPLQIPNQNQISYSQFFPFVINPVAPISSPIFQRPGDIEKLLKQYITSTRSNLNTTCTYFSSVGVCQSHAHCSLYEGRPTTYCRDVTKFCCLYRWSCDVTTEQKAGYFRNPDYPLSSQITTSCGITVRKINSDICTVRIEPQKMQLPANIGFCQDLAFHIDGVPGKDYEPLCGDLSQKTYDIDVSSTDTITLRINTNRASRLVWNVKVTQIPCSESGYSSTWPLIGGTELEPPPQIINEIPQVLPQQSSPIIPVSAPGLSTSLINTQAVCGTAHKRSGLNVRDRGPLSPTTLSFLRLQQFLQGYGLNDQQFPTRDDDECDDRLFGGNCHLQLQETATGQNPLLQSLDWSVPIFNDSILHKYAGTTLRTDQRITYGKKTAPHTHPWNVAMYDNGRFHCGATLISDRHVLTAAHCVIKSKRRPEKLKLSIGDWDINSNTDGPSVNGEIAEIITHPGYSTHTLKYDIAVLKLKQSLQFSDTIVPVCLPSSDMNLEGQIITVSGWGRDEKNKLQSQLMAHSAAVVSNTICNERWEQKGAPKGIIADTMLCMDPQDGDSCKGDSGGPAILEYPPNSNKFVQVGVVSFGSASCTDKNLPGVYTKVSTVTDWIQSQLKT